MDVDFAFPSIDALLRHLLIFPNDLNHYNEGFFLSGGEEKDVVRVGEMGDNLAATRNEVSSEPWNTA